MFTGHTWGKVVCDRDGPDAYQMLIFSTGRGGENAARQLQRTSGSLAFTDATPQTRQRASPSRRRPFEVRHDGELVAGQGVVTVAAGNGVLRR